MRRSITALLLVSLVLSQSNDSFENLIGPPNASVVDPIGQNQKAETNTVNGFLLARPNNGGTLQLNKLLESLRSSSTPTPAPTPAPTTPAPTTPAPTTPAPTPISPSAQGTASLQFAPLATNVNMSDPVEIGGYLVGNIASDLRSNFTQFLSPPSRDNCCINQIPIEVFSENFENTTALSNLDYKQFKGQGAPNPGNWKIAGSSPSPSPWSYHRCPSNGKHLWVNGINSNWNPFYRRIFWGSKVVEKGAYKLCFKIRNLPQATWDAKPFGFVALYQDIAKSNYFWNVNLPTSSGCSWNSISTTKFAAEAGTLNFTIYLYNGETEDGNDLVMDDVKLIRLAPPVQQPSFTYSILNFVGNKYEIRLASKQTAAFCKDNFYLRTNNNLFVLNAANVTISTTNEYTFLGLLTKTNYEIGVKRVCDCNEDSFWRFSFNLNLDIFTNAVNEVRSVLVFGPDETAVPQNPSNPTSGLSNSGLSNSGLSNSGLSIQSQSNAPFDG